MDTKKLRQKILDLAIRGKLVPQDPNDEPASVLLERIRTEKERLVKEGKIKKSKASKTSDTPHYEQVPFEVPSSWVWTTINNIAFVTKLAGFEYTKYIAENISTSEGVPLFKGKNILNGEIVYKFEAYIPLDISNELFRSQITKRCLLTPYVGTIGNIGIHDKEGVYHLGSNVGKIELFNNDNLNIYEEFVKNYLLSSFGYKELTKQKKATAQESISIEAIREVLLPLPPLVEQKRIITEIERWFALIDTIENNQDDLQETIQQAKSKILDLAIHGKLVPQDPNDEPASELLKRINPKAEITCDNGQYGKIPKGWCLVTGTSLFKQMKSAKPKGKLFKYIDIDSIDNKSNIVSSIKEIPTIEAPSRASRYTEKGDVVFSMVRPYLRNIARITENYCIASTGFYICSPYNCMLSKFCYYLMLSNYVVDGLNTFMKGDNSPSITKREIDNWLYPLPPMNEQYRIVAKIEEIFTILDRIELSLRMS